MKRYIYSIAVIVSMCSLMGYADIEYRKALESDIPSLLDLMKEAASSYDDRMMIVPEACRQSFLKNLIDKDILFVAVSDGKVVGTKKFFIAEGTEKKDIFENLVRSEGKKGKAPSLQAKVGVDGKIIDAVTTLPMHDWGICLYTGFSYTLESFRRQNIQKKLTEYAYKTVAQEVNDRLKKSDQKKVSLIAMLTAPNVGIKPQEGYKDGYDRTSSLAKGFQFFIKQYIDTSISTTPEVILSRYNSYMPVFPSDSKTCDNPLSDEQSHPAYGFVFTYECTISK